MTRAVLALALALLAGCAAPGVTESVLTVAPGDSIRLRFTFPDSVEWRRGCGWSRADSARAAHSDMRAEVHWIPRFGPPYWPPVYRDSTLCVTGWRLPGSAVDTTIYTPGHGTLYVATRNAAGSHRCPSNYTKARTVE